MATNVGTDQDRLGDHLLKGLDAAGVPFNLGGTTLPFQFGRLDQLERIFETASEPLAAVVMEATRGDHPPPGFLQGVKDLCSKHGAKLIFDEVSSGWKHAVGGAHLLYGVYPDMAVFAKSTANGHPMGAVIGNEATMQAAQGSFISSSFWTEGVGPAAALAAIRKMMRIDVVGHVDRIGEKIKQVWLSLGARYGLPLSVNGHNVNAGFVSGPSQGPGPGNAVHGAHAEGRLHGGAEGPADPGSPAPPRGGLRRCRGTGVSRSWPRPLRAETSSGESEVPSSNQAFSA